MEKMKNAFETFVLATFVVYFPVVLQHLPQFSVCAFWFEFSAVFMFEAQQRPSSIGQPSKSAKQSL